MATLSNFAGQNWLITPAAQAVSEPPPANIYQQKWLLVLSGVVIANFQGNSTSQWLSETVTILPDVGDNPDLGPLNWAISQYGIPRPPANTLYNTVFSVDEWAPFASLSSIYDQAQSIDAGYAVNDWRPTHFQTGTDVMTNAAVSNIFTGIDVDMAVRDTDAYIYRLSYNITLRGRIVFTANTIF